MSKQTLSDPHCPNVIFYTDNGMGLGHLTRQSAVALQAQQRFNPYFLTMSAGYQLPRRLGIATEYFPSYGRLGLDRSEWENLFVGRMIEAIVATRATAMVVDHVSPPRVFQRLRERTHGVTYIWSRRGMWQPERNRHVLELASTFDIVVEPGDYASPIDQGPTAEDRSNVVITPPVVLVQPDEYLDRDAARDLLGLPATGRCILLNLGDTDPSQVGRLIRRARDVIRGLTNEPMHLFAPLHPLHGDRIPRIRGVHQRPVYPVAKFFNAFDGVVSTSGYNSFHELVVSGLPVVFVPHQHARIDDQFRRAEFASMTGRAQWVPSLMDASFISAARRMLRPIEPKAARATATALGPADGAAVFASLIADIAQRPSSEGSPGGRPAPKSLSPLVHRVAIVDATRLSDDELKIFADGLDDDAIRSIAVLIQDADPAPLYDLGVVFESTLSGSELNYLAPSTHSSYVRARLERMRSRYGAESICEPADINMENNLA